MSKLEQPVGSDPERSSSSFNKKSKDELLREREHGGSDNVTDEDEVRAQGRILPQAQMQESTGVPGSKDAHKGH